MGEKASTSEDVEHGVVGGGGVEEATAIGGEGEEVKGAVRVGVAEAETEEEGINEGVGEKDWGLVEGVDHGGFGGRGGDDVEDGVHGFVFFSIAIVSLSRVWSGGEEGLIQRRESSSSTSIDDTELGKHCFFFYYYYFVGICKCSCYIGLPMHPMSIRWSSPV